MIDKQFLLTQLQETRDIFLNSFAGVTEEQSRVKPAPDRWSVLDTIEHLTTAEGIQLKLISTQRTPRAADAPNREGAFLQMHQSSSLDHSANDLVPRFDAAEQTFGRRAGVIQFLRQYPWTIWRLQ